MYLTSTECNKIAKDYKILSNTHLYITCRCDTHAVWLSVPDYWYWIENGRRAGKMPPVRAIMNWKINHRLPKELSAWAVAKTIAKRGVVGKLAFEKTYEKNKTVLDYAVEQKMKDMFGAVIKDLTDI